MLNTPVALIIFNRPAATERVFAEVVKARPSKLFIIADGPREDRPADVEQCEATRAVVERVNWDCEVHRNYSEVNLGCGVRPATGITWVFEHVEEAIILEDDCVPVSSFFPFCQELLERYRREDRVMMIGGRYHQFNMADWARRFKHSYTFAYNHTNWGWATWKRAWQHFDFEMKQWPELRDSSWLLEMFEDQQVAEFWERIFDEASTADARAHIWDQQWTFSCFARRGLAILPKTHLVANVGFGEDATHTTRANPERGGLLASELEFPLVHPPAVERDVEFDRRFAAAIVGGQRPRRLGWRTKVRRRLRNTVSNALAIFR